MNEKNTTDITMGPPILEKWLRSHYVMHKSNEIIITTDPTDTIMRIELKTEPMPEFDNDS